MTFTDEFDTAVSARRIADAPGEYPLCPDWWPQEAAPRIRGNQTARMSERRRDLLAALSEPENGFKVVAYALTTVHHVPTNTLGRVRAYAAHKGWRVHSEPLWDGCGMTRPLERTEWQRAERLVAGGYVHGILTLDQSAVSTDNGEYEEVLNRLESRPAFIAHVPPEWRPSVSPTLHSLEDRDV